MEPKKYKHIRTGNIAEQQSNGRYLIDVENDQYIVPEWVIRDNDGWQLVKEPEYTILSFKSECGSSTVEWNEKKQRYVDEYCSFTLQEMLKGEHSVEDGQWKIWSVRRHNDNSIWTIGDKVGNNLSNSNWSMVIDKIEMDQNQPCGISLVNKGQRIALAHVKKVTEPETCTITVEDRVYSVHKLVADEITRVIEGKKEPE